MKRVRIPDETKSRSLVFYLALEEYLANLNEKDWFYVWQSRPTVIIGRNQILKAEVNEEFCKKRGIDIYRRKSGGGCVYSDSGNLMISFITSKKNPQEAFDYYLDKLANTLRNLGLEAVKTENNDLLVNGYKISGNAYYGKNDASIVHGTLLYDMNLDDMARAITPPLDKVYKHGIKSVRQRVVNMKELGLDLSVEDIKKHLVKEFCDDKYILTPEDMRKVEEIENTYLDPEFIKGKEE